MSAYEEGYSDGQGSMDLEVERLEAENENLKSALKNEVKEAFDLGYDKGMEAGRSTGANAGYELGFEAALHWSKSDEYDTDQEANNFSAEKA